MLKYILTYPPTDDYIVMGHPIRVYDSICNSILSHPLSIDRIRNMCKETLVERVIPSRLSPETLCVFIYLNKKSERMMNALMKKFNICRFDILNIYFLLFKDIPEYNWDISESMYLRLRCPEFIPITSDEKYKESIRLICHGFREFPRVIEYARSNPKIINREYEGNSDCKYLHNFIKLNVKY
jgi:hypothetical protein